MRRSTKRSSCLRGFPKKKTLQTWKKNSLWIWKLRFFMEFRISITSISLKRGLTKMGFYVFPFYLFIASQLHGYLISHLLGLGLRAACPWRSLCPQVPTQISGNQFSVQRLSTSFFFCTGHGKWKTLPEAHIFAPIKKWWVGRRSFPFWEGSFSGGYCSFWSRFSRNCPFPGQVTSGFLAASAGKVSAWLCDFARCSKKKRERLLSFMSRDFRYSQLLT